MKKNLYSTKTYLLIALLLIANNSFAQSAVLNLKMFIQGYYCGYMGNICHNNTAAMQRVLYNECVVTDSNSTQCDTVTISLLDSLGILDYATKGVLQTNGSLTLTFPDTVIGKRYYIYINYRNAIETSSANPVKFDTLTSYDFTTGASQAYGDNEVEVDTGAWAIYNGELNQDCFIDPFDLPQLLADSGLKCYVNADLNGDGIVDSLDLAILSYNVSMSITCNVPDGPFATGIPSIAGASGIYIFPNPVAGQLRIETKGQKIIRIIIYNPLGEIVKSRNTNDNLITIDMDDEPAGVYFANILDADKNIINKKIIKQ